MSDMTVLINGEVSDGRIPVSDSSVLRGDGCFEVIRAYDGRPFRLGDHLDRLAASAAALDIDLPPREKLAAWIEDRAQELGDCAVRVVVTRGSAVPGETDQPRVIVFGHPWNKDPRPATLAPVVAPWHAAGTPWDLAGAKLLSYAPNLAASRRAVSDGFDDALLLTVDNVMLEGPTFAVAWVVDGLLETPTLDLGILDSITRRIVLAEARSMGIDVTEGSWSLDRLGEASEAMALSTVREVQAVSRVGPWEFAPGPVTSALADAFAALIA